MRTPPRRSFRRSAAAASLLAVGVLAAGCLGEAKLTDYHAAATGGWFSVGYAYDGKGASSFGGFITVHADDEHNGGDAAALGQLNGQDWHIEFVSFAEQPGKAFQDGGIAHELCEHGDSGNGDASIPRVHAEMAAWGQANVTVGGNVLVDPVTRNSLWTAHYMVLTTGVRDDVTRAIHDASKAGTYDPREPADGFADPNDAEVHLVLKSGGSTPGNVTPIRPIQGSFGPTPYAMTHTLVTNEFQGAAANLTMTLSGTGTTAVSSPVYLVKAPSGQVVWSKDGPVGGTVPIHVELLELGAYTLEVSGHVIPDLSYRVEGTVKPPAVVVLNFWWEDVAFGDAAAAFEASAEAGHGHM